MRKLFRRRCIKALAIALSLVVLPFVALWWLSTSADRQLQSEKDRLSALGFPMTLEERKAYFETKGSNAGPFLDELGERYVALKHKTPLPGEDPRPFLREFEPLLREFLKIHQFDSYYRESDIAELLVIGPYPGLKPREVMKAALFCAEEACKREDIEEAIRIFEAVDHLGMITAQRGDVNSYIMGVRDLSAVGASYAKCASTVKSREPVTTLLDSAIARTVAPEPESAYLLQPGIEARMLDAIELQVRNEFGITLLDELKGGLPETEQEWVYRVPHMRKRMIAEELAVWRRFLENKPTDKKDWRAYQKAYGKSFQVLANQDNMASRVAREYTDEKDYASDVYVSEQIRRRARIMGMRIVAGIPHEPEVDIFTGEPLKVRRDKPGILVYSVGPNLVDDNGEEDDIRIAIRYNPVLSNN